MKLSIRTELPNIIVALVPLGFLVYLWNDLPEQVPMHWNASGEIDRYGGKTELIMIPFLLPWLVYGIMLVAPYIDPKNKIQQMGGKFHQIKFFLVLCMSLIAMYIIYSAKAAETTDPSIVFILIGLLYVVLGNYMKTIKRNYFIGIRTPWALENEENWRKTHALGGITFLIGGVLVILTSLLLEGKAEFVAFISVTAVSAIIPVVKSYLIFRNKESS